MTHTKSSAIFLLFCFTSLASAQEFSFKMVFEDSKGNKDSLIFGYDPSASWGVDTAFGEINIHGQIIDTIFDVRVSDELESPNYTINEYDTYSLKKQIIGKDCDNFPSPIAINFRCTNWPVTASWDSTLFNTECLVGSVLTGAHPGGWWCVFGESDLGRVLLNQKSQVRFTSNIHDYAIQDSIAVFWVAMSTKNHLSLEVDLMDHEHAIHIYPNPTTGTIFIDNRGPKTIHHIELVDTSGKIHSVSETLEVVNLDGYESGIYLLKAFLSDQSIVIRKIIKY